MQKRPCQHIVQAIRQHLVWNFGGQRQFMCLRYVSVSCDVGQFCLYWLYNCPNVRWKYACDQVNGQFDFRNGSNYPNLRQMKWFHGNFGELPFARYVNYPMHFEKLKSSLKSGEFLLVRNMNYPTPQKNLSRLLQITMKIWSGRE